MNKTEDILLIKPYYDRPCAADGLLSYRYRGSFGWIMIGAKNEDDALRQAARSTSQLIDRAALQRWNGSCYEDFV